MPENPSPQTLSKDLQEIYSRRFQGNLEYRNRVWQTLTEDFFSQWIGPADRVLDLGCGYCQFINHIACGEKYGMDLNPASRGRLKPEITFLEQDCAATWNVPADSLDVFDGLRDRNNVVRERRR